MRDCRVCHSLVGPDAPEDRCTPCRMLGLERDLDEAQARRLARELGAEAPEPPESVQGDLFA